MAETEAVSTTYKSLLPYKSTWQDLLLTILLLIADHLSGDFIILPVDLQHPSGTFCILKEPLLFLTSPHYVLPPKYPRPWGSVLHPTANSTSWNGSLKEPSHFVHSSYNPRCDVSKSYMGGAYVHVYVYIMSNHSLADYSKTNYG